MYTFNDLRDKIKRYFRFSREETKAVIIAILVYGFIISFRQWGGVEFQFFAGLKNFFIGIIIMAVTILVHVFIQRIAALHVGFRPEYKLWIYGIIISLGLCIITNGNIWFLFLPGGIYLHMMSQHRLGYFRYGLNLHAHALIAFTGTLANLTLAIIFRMLQSVLPISLFLQKIVLVNLLFAVFSMLPIPPLNGSRIIYYSRMTYVFFLGVMLGTIIFLVSNVGILLMIIGSLFLGALIWLLYYIVLERKFWGSAR